MEGGPITEATEGASLRGAREFPEACLVSEWD